MSKVTINQPHHRGEETAAQRTSAACRSTAGPLMEGQAEPYAAAATQPLPTYKNRHFMGPKLVFTGPKNYWHKQTFCQVLRRNQALGCPRAFVLTVPGMLCWISLCGEGTTENPSTLLPGFLLQPRARIQQDKCGLINCELVFRSAYPDNELTHVWRSYT